jgi:hypothetical protein
MTPSVGVIMLPGRRSISGAASAPSGVRPAPASSRRNAGVLAAVGGGGGGCCLGGNRKTGTGFGFVHRFRRRGVRLARCCCSRCRCGTQATASSPGAGSLPALLAGETCLCTPALTLEHQVRGCSTDGICQLANVRVPMRHTQNNQVPLWGFRTPGDGVVWRIGEVIVRSLHSAECTTLWLEARTSSEYRGVDTEDTVAVPEHSRLNASHQAGPITSRRVV